MYVPDKFVSNEKYILQTKIDLLINTNKANKSTYKKLLLDNNYKHKHKKLKFKKLFQFKIKRYNK